MKYIEGNADKNGLEGSYGAIWETIKSMNIMFGKLKKAADKINYDPDNYSAHYCAGIDAAYCKLIKYFDLTDKTPTYRAAMVLHPAYKMDYFEQVWADQKEWLAACRRDVKSLYQKYANSYVAEVQTEPLIEQPINYNRAKGSSSEDDIRRYGHITDAYRAKKKKKVKTEWE